MKTNLEKRTQNAMTFTEMVTTRWEQSFKETEKLLFITGC